MEKLGSHGLVSFPVSFFQKLYQETCMDVHEHGLGPGDQCDWTAVANMLHGPKPCLSYLHKNSRPHRGTMRFESTAKALAECKLKYYGISECEDAATPLAALHNPVEYRDEPHCSLSYCACGLLEKSIGRALAHGDAAAEQQQHCAP